MTRWSQASLVELDCPHSRLLTQTQAWGEEHGNEIPGITQLHVTVQVLHCSLYIIWHREQWSSKTDCLWSGCIQTVFRDGSLPYHRRSCHGSVQGLCILITNPIKFIIMIFRQDSFQCTNVSVVHILKVCAWKSSDRNVAVCQRRLSEYRIQ